MLQQLDWGIKRQANVAEIEAALSAMWRSAAGDGQNNSPVTRASALTLLVYVESEESAGEVSNLIADVASQNPCRTILMLIEPGASPKEVMASVSAHCQIPVGGEKQNCSQQITLHARSEAGPELASLALPLTVSGLPIYLWWRAGSFNVPSYFDQILRVTQQVVVDSARFSATRADLRDLANWLKIYSGRIRLSDLNWARATPWRELVAQCFDSPERRPYLDLIDTVRVEYEMDSARLSAQRAQSLLLSRPGWPAAWVGNCEILKRAAKISHVLTISARAAATLKWRGYCARWKRKPAAFAFPWSSRPETRALPSPVTWTARRRERLPKFPLMRPSVEPCGLKCWMRSRF